MAPPKKEKTRKRNNFTLSTEAQDIIKDKENKSKFVSEAIVEKENTLFSVVKK
jgi:hypothetical protein